MGKKPKSSRKGKKAWRANISTDDIDEFIEKSTKDALTGGSLAEVPNESLFFVDKSKDLSVKRKIEKHREKVLHCDSVLQRNPFVKAIPSSNDKKKSSMKNKKNKKDSTEASTSKDDATKDGESGIVDLWENEAEGDIRTRKVVKTSVIPAVEVDPPGCSYNPNFEAHQDSLAKAVAEEMQKVYQSELGPQPVPLTVQGDAIEEEEMYFLEVDNGDDEANEENEDAPEKSSSMKKMVTKVEFNRRARLKDRQKKESEAKKKAEISKEIDSLPTIIDEIAKEDEEKQKRMMRRLVAKQERLKQQPPRLGRHKFVPAPTQVLLSEEITGSLRKLKACCTLATDRFKSLEKRGLIPPSANKRRRKYNFAYELRFLAGDKVLDLYFIDDGEAEEAAGVLIDVRVEDEALRKLRLKHLEEMRTLAAHLRTYLRGRPAGNVQRSRNFCSSPSVNRADEAAAAMEEEAERKIGWLLKVIFAGTATAIGYQFFPYMGDNLVLQSISLLQVKDPFFKRSGASRLASYAIDDGRRMKIVELGGAQELLNMLEAAKDDRTRKAALEALAALTKSDKAAGALHKAGAIPIVQSTPSSVEEEAIDKYKTGLLKRFQDLKYDGSS
ncbi:unnamed protein product [Linum tenue]|uniref:Ribosome biogenesis protein NOP53 n=1 Tax=Linum tenue TaxID=586396 RepID=A0AAV0K1Z1_9ROSI|nr:unnamed protein product [Linum tenue]